MYVALTYIPVGGLLTGFAMRSDPTGFSEVSAPLTNRACGRSVYLESSRPREKAALPEGPSQELAFFWRATLTAEAQALGARELRRIGLILFVTPVVVYVYAIIGQDDCSLYLPF